MVYLFYYFVGDRYIPVCCFIYCPYILLMFVFDILLFLFMLLLLDTFLFIIFVPRPVA